MKFICLTQVEDGEWSDSPETIMVSINADAIMWMQEHTRPEWEPVGLSAVTHIQFYGSTHGDWMRVVESIKDIEALLA